MIGTSLGRRLRAFATVLALVLAAATAGAATVVVTAPPAAAAASDPGLPSHTAIVAAARRALDYYRPTYATTTLTPRNGWSWGTYFEGVQDVYRYTGDARFQSDGMAWGASNAWNLTTSETNPDTIKAGQVYHALHQVDPAASLAAMDARMAADLTGLPLSRYDWIDALFMGLPDWALWSTRTANPAYLEKMDALFAWTRDQGATSSRCAGTVPPQSGLFDASRGLWYRDCTYVGATDANGKPIVWLRGNGWVIAAMADVLRSLPAGDARAATYAGMLRTMAAALTPLQGSDGFWRPSLLDAAAFPQPETSGTALITYALAYGIRAGVLDGATYLPVVARAWEGLTSTALQADGFLRDCQPAGVEPAAPYTATAPRTAPTATSSGTVNVDSPPFCVGAFAMAAVQVARLVPSLAAGRPVTATAQQVGNEAPRVVDGDVTTRWSAAGFPQAVTVDLGSTQTIGSAMVVPYLSRAYRYRIEGSTDGSVWTLAVDRSANTQGGTLLDDVPAVQARYVRLTVLGVAGGTTTWASIQELTVHAPPVTAPPVDAVAVDGFGRTVSGGWGSAELGGAWTTVGSASSFSVTSGQGRMLVPTPGVGRSAILSAVSQDAVDAQVTAALDKPATGGGTDLALTGRYTGPGTEYRTEAKILATGAVRLALRRFTSGTATTLTQITVPALTYTPGARLHIRIQVQGTNPTTLRARTWLDGQNEPTTWQAQTTDTTPALQAPGAVGLATYVSASATTTPTTATFDDLHATPLD